MKKRFILLLLLTLSVGSIFAQTRNTSAFFNAFLLTPPGPGGTGTCLGVIRFEYRTCAGVIFVTINGNATWCCVGCECSFASDFGTGTQDRSFAPGEYDIEAEFCCRPGRNSGCNVLPQGSVALFHVSIPNACCQSAADCDDGNACNGSETCNNAGFCQPGTELVCDDDNVCNGLETCNPSSGCVAGILLDCSNNNVCDGIETCDPQLGCQAGTELVCDDGKPCTVNGCGFTIGCIFNPAPAFILGYADADSDFYGNVDTLVWGQCNMPPTENYTQDSTDCDDTNPNINPDAKEICGNGIDENCWPADDACSQSTWYRDADFDGFGAPGTGITQEEQPEPNDMYVLNDEDCNDEDIEINPLTEWFVDADDDGFYGKTVVVQCEQPVRGVLTPDENFLEDCDNDQDRNPGLVDEPGNGIDENCDGEDGTKVWWYHNDDDDLYWADESVFSVEAPATAHDWMKRDDIFGFIAGDCDDNNPNIYPDAFDDPYTPADENCDGDNNKYWYRDFDHDGWDEAVNAKDAPGPDWSLTPTGQNGPVVGLYFSCHPTTPLFDCADNDRARYPRATHEVCGDNIDTDCNCEDGTSDCRGELSVIIEVDPNVGIGCPDGATFTATYDLDNCFDKWDLFAPDLNLLGEDVSWTGINKGETKTDKITNVAGSGSRQLLFVAQPDGQLGERLCTSKTYPELSSPANCAGNISLESQTIATPGQANGSATFRVQTVIPRCGVFDQTFWLQLTNISNGTIHTCFDYDQFNSYVRTVNDLPAGEYSVVGYYAMNLCTLSVNNVTIIDDEITTQPISGNNFCPQRVITITDFQVHFSSTATFDAGNVFTAQLSDLDGSFNNNPTPIGSLSGTSSSGFINAHLPFRTLPPGSGYLVRVVSSSPMIIGSDNGAAFTILDALDRDNDGVSLCTNDPINFPVDCADDDADRFPGNEEDCNDGKDNDCDGVVDVNTCPIPVISSINPSSTGVRINWSLPDCVQGANLRITFVANQNTPNPPNRPNRPNRPNNPNSNNPCSNRTQTISETFGTTETSYQVSLCPGSYQGELWSLCQPGNSSQHALFSFNICSGNSPCSPPVFKTDGETSANEVTQTAEYDLGKLETYPNPFSDNLNIEFMLTKDSRVKLEIFNISGQRIATLFEGEVKAAELQKLEYNPAAACDCIFIYRLQTEQGIYYGKAVMVR